MKIANLDEAMALLVQFIPPRPNAKIVYKLDTIRALLRVLGDPQDQLRVIHVAGTSGKTSTAYYVAALLRAAGKRVGLTVSPHIEAVNERVQIDGAPLAEAAFCAHLGELMDQVQASGLKPTYFELLIALAYWEFARQKVEYAVVEVGLGGLLDGTNVVTRADKVCVITDIGLDHVHILGTTLAAIATQKAGIIQPHNEVFMYEQSEEVMQAVRRVCTEKEAKLQLVSPEFDSAVRSLPSYQQRNITLAAAVVDRVLQRDEQRRVNSDMLHVAVKTRIPGRLETFRIGDKTVLLDGAHNPQKLQAMAASVRAAYPEQSIAALLGFVQTKMDDLPENAQLMLGLTQRIIATEFEAAQEHGPPALAAEMVAAACRQAGASDVTIETDFEKALLQLLQSPEPLLLVTGSLYLVSYVRPLVLKMAAHSATPGIAGR